MPVNEQHVRRCLRSFDLKKLFKEELGWDRLSTPYAVTVDGISVALEPIAQKRGMVALLCPPVAGGGIPDYKHRGLIEREVTKAAREHIIIYVDGAKTTQVWQWAKREKGRPIARREHTWRAAQTGEALVQKLRNIAFAIDDEDELSLVAVTDRARAAFDVEKVTKRFFELFRVEHEKFLGFIEGIQAQGDREWYASVMLNRLMFIYFIQKKGFLDGDDHYLRNRLARVQRARGTGQFHSFYRYFLLRLFHDGLGGRERSKELDELLGSVPYLNGGIFSPHQLEQDQTNDIDIADEAFQRVFDFFDGYHWHLDDRPLRNDTEINPDVLGFIFEKYINQKQMGAYYTKEDITEYISRSTVVPYLFDAARNDCRIAFDPEGSVWRQPKERPDRYIFEPVAKGCTLPLPPDIEAGVADVARRGNWNHPASEEYALPTEIWRETVARREHWTEVRAKLAGGEVTSINDFITYNLDIRRLAEDVITESEGPELVRSFWKALTTVRILDPTVGSGAFLFAALNILEPLYEACLNRMEVFVEEGSRAEARSAIGTQPYHDFRVVLKQVSDHRDRRYHIFKSIIVNNLYGVDIMEEATEICKLRLFLKLVSVVERVDDIEPLPDIDFNIRAGNTLVGYASREELRKAVEGGEQGKLGYDEDVLKAIEHKASLVDKQFVAFREAQTAESVIAKGELGARQKAAIQAALADLRTELDAYLGKQYGKSAGLAFAKWKESHKPFHWFVEFYGVLNAGGFDVIIGNPPYVEYSKIRSGYAVKDYATTSCGNLNCFVTERAISLLGTTGCLGFIIPLAGFATARMEPFQRVVTTGLPRTYISHFSGDAHPSVLFQGVKYRLSILIGDRRGGVDTQIFTTNYNRWYADARSQLFGGLTYRLNRLKQPQLRFAKVSSNESAVILNKLMRQTRTMATYDRKRGDGHIAYHRSPVFWIRALDFEPYFKSDTRRPAEKYGWPSLSEQD